MIRLICLLLFGSLLVHGGSLTLAERQQDCQEFHFVQNGETCETIAFGFDLNLTDVKRAYDCEQLAIGDSICVSDVFTCRLRHEVHLGDTCDSLQMTYKVNHTELEHMNLNVACENSTLTVGKYICVWGAHDRPLPRMGCTEWRALNTSDMGCYDVAEDIGMTVDEFRFLNPHLDCSGDPIPIETSVCIRGRSSVTCSQIDLVDANKTCNDYYRHYSMTMDQLIVLNPTLKCDSIQYAEQICAGVGPFKNTECVETARVVNTTQTCDKQVAMTQLTMEQIKTFNPTIDCTKQLDISSLLCVTWLGMDTRVAQNTIVSSFQDTEQELVEKHIAYRRLRTAPNAYAVNMHLHQMLIRPEINAQMKDMYANNATIATIVDNQFPLPRQHYCDTANRSNTTQEIKSCYCGTEELLTYCQSLAQQRFQDNGGYDDIDDDDDDDDASSASRSFSRIVKSSSNSQIPKKREEEGCKIFDSESLESYDQIKDQEFGMSCTFPVDIVDIDLNFLFHVPIVEEDNDVVTKCTPDGMECETAMSWDDAALRRLADFSDIAALELCLIGTDWLKVFKKGDSGLCWEVIRIEYRGVVGLMDLSTSVNFIAFKIIGGMIINVHGMAIPSMCQRAEFQCEEYCKFAYNRYKSTQTSGYMELRALSILGFPGIKIKEHRFHEPKKLGCEDKKEAAVVVRNGRTCQNAEFNNVQWRCTSDDGIVKSGTFTKLYDFDGVAFKPKKDTRYQCAFTDSFGETIEIVAYGGSSGNLGKQSFFYVFKDDGLYFGTVGYKEQTQLFKWKNPCPTDPSQDITNIQKGMDLPTTAPCTWVAKENIPKHAAWVTFRNERTCQSDQMRRVHVTGDETEQIDSYLDKGEQVSHLFATHKHSRLLTTVAPMIGDSVNFYSYDVTTDRKCSCPKEYFFFIRNEGVYYSDTNCPDEDELMKNLLVSFIHPCDSRYANDKLNPTGVSAVPAAKCQKNVLGYYTGWGDREISSSQLKKLTHVVYTHLVVEPDGSIQFGEMGEAGNSTGQSIIKTIMRWRSLVENARGAYSGVRIMIRVGGISDVANLRLVAENPGVRRTFVAALKAFVTAHGVDGVELGLHNDALTNSHYGLLNDLRTALGYDKTISVAVSGNPDLIDFQTLSLIHDSANIVSVMTNDLFSGNSTAPPSPLFPSNSSEESLTKNIDYVMRKFVCKTGRVDKFHFSLPFYGRLWKNVEHSVNSSALWNSGEQGGMIGWKNLERDGFNLDVTQFDEDTKLPYIYNNAAKTFLGFENEKSVVEKISYAANMGHGGLTTWAMDLDDAADTLLDLVSSSQEFCAPKQKQSYNCQGV